MPQRSEGMQEDEERSALEELRAVVGADDLGHVSQVDIQRVMRAATKLYSARLKSGGRFAPFHMGPDLTQTDIAIVVTQMLRRADIELHELALWEAWGTP